MSKKLPRSKIFMRVRKFLNRPGFHSTAAVLAEVRRDRQHVNLALEISDCSRKITLSLDTYDEENLNNTLRKLDILAETLARVRTVVTVAMDEAETWKAQHPEKPHSLDKG